MFLRKKPDGLTIPGRRDPVEDIGMRVLRFLAEHRLEPTPRNYELGYLAQSDRHSLTGRAIDAVLIAGDPFTQAEADRIHVAHRKTVAGSDADEERHQARLRVQALRLADLTADAAVATGRFGRSLEADLPAFAEGDTRSAPVREMIERTRQAEAKLAESARQVDALRQEVAAAKDDAARDALTGLSNRRGIEAELTILDGSRRASLAMCDIDDFKQVNDRHGHDVGDRVLKAVAASLAESCAPHHVARWGGEEFIIIMDGLTLPAAAALIEAARGHLAARELKMRETGQPLGTITISAGVVAIGGRRTVDAIGQADELLYVAKGAGKNRVEGGRKTSVAA